MRETDGRKLKHDLLEALRIRAVRRIEQGESPETVIKALGMNRRTIYKWIARYREGGIDGLRATPLSGRPLKLSGAKLQWIFKAVTTKNPLQLRFPCALWTREMVKELIERKYGIGLSVVSVGRLFARLGLTPQKPILRASEQDPEEIRQWLEEKYPVIRKQARKRHAYIVFVDESGFMLSPLLRRTWAPRGQTPVIRVSEPHDRISVIGAIAISPRRSHFSFYFHLLEDNANFHGNSVVEFIDEIRRKIRKPIILLWDTIPIHRAKPVENYIAEHPRIVAEPFPPYAPELNPVDNVWSHVKYARLPNYSLLDLRGLRRCITAEFDRLKKRPDLLKSFFNRTGLTL